MMSDFPLAYHITFGTYGTRLHGDPRGTVDRRHNDYGESIIGQREAWQVTERRRLSFPPVLLDAAQRMFFESEAMSVCQRGGWALIVSAAAEDHVHVMLRAEADGKVVRALFKRWMGELLSDRWQLPDGATWWAEGGSVKWVWNVAYLQNIRGYIERQRTFVS